MKTSLLRKLFLFSPIALLFLASSPVNAVDSVFPDVSSKYPYEGAVSEMKSDSVVQGYPDGTYKPDQTMNRAEFIKIVVASRVSNPTGANCFKDVKDDWYAKYVCTAKARGWIKGYPDGNFRPGQNINVVESSKILTSSFSLSAGASGSEWFAPYVRALESKKAIPTSIDYTDRKVTRGEMAEMVWRLKDDIETKPTKTYAALTSGYPTIASCAELQEKFAMHGYVQTRVVEYGRSLPPAPMPPLMDMAAPAGAAAEGEAMAESAAPSQASTDYSSTNVQVEGVDEADIVKNDGQYIYVLKGTTVRIVKAFPPTELSELPKIDLTTQTDANFSPSDMYVDGNDLVVIGNAWGGEKSQTMVVIFDITNRSAISFKRKVSFDGNYVSSRKIGDRVFLVMNDQPLYRILPMMETTEPQTIPQNDLVPTFTDSRVGREMPVVPCSQVHFYPQYSDMNFLVVAAVPLSGADSQTVKKEVFMGSGEQVYASLENLYVAANHYDYNEQIKYDIWMPPVTNTKTVLYRFSLDPAGIEFKGSGEVPGQVKDQFSMDENGNAFRVMTHTESYYSGSGTSGTHLFILNKDNLEQTLGKIENIAPNEDIHSVRFLGKRAYLVTFNQIDPFFVIDVEDPSNPRILGELKIPGYSDYLHPFDENHVIGFGKEVDPTIDADKVHTENAVYYTAVQGLKIALFDVTDVSHPTAMFTEIIGDSGTDSEVLSNHKALFYDKVRNLFAIPVSVFEIPNKELGAAGGDTYGQWVFQGAYVYSLDLEHGFQKKAMLTHFPDGFKFDYSYSDPTSYQTISEQGISRVVRIGDYLYTVSPGTVKAWAIVDMSAQGSATLEPAPQEPIYVYPMGGIIE